MNNTAEDKKNLQTAYDLVEQYFSISKDDLPKVKERIFNPYSFVNEPIKNLFKNSPDGRVRFDIPPELLESSDQGWTVFTSSFSAFVSNFNLSYIDFRDNKVTVKKNRVKLKKVLEDFYKLKEGENLKRCQHDPMNWNIVYSTMRSFGIDTTEDIQNMFNLANKIIDVYFSITKMNPETIPVFLQEARDLIVKDYNKIVEQSIKYIMEISSRFKIPKKSGMQIVFTRNFADWMLCSTGEKWSSCLSLNSDYHACFWSGIPGLLGDPNRVMIYITDGKKKSFEGIETDRFICRAWGVYSTDDEFVVSRWYDQKKFKHKDISEFSGWPLRPKTGVEYTSLLPLDPIFFESGDSSFIYIDNGSITKINNEYYLLGNTGDSDAYTISKRTGDVRNDTAWSLEVDRGLSHLIEKGESLMNFDPNEYFHCDNCDSVVNIDEENSYTTADGDTICYHCFTNHFRVCSSTGEIYHNNDIIEVHDYGAVNCDDVDNIATEIDGTFYLNEEVKDFMDSSGNTYPIHEESIEDHYVFSQFHDCYIEEENTEFISTEGDYYHIVYLKEYRSRGQSELFTEAS